MCKPSIAEVTDDARLPFIDAATVEYGTDNVQFDTDARVIDNEEDGHWVQGWVFVSYPDNDDEL